MYAWNPGKPLLPILDLTMPPANRTTKFYFFLLILNISAGSLLFLLILDAVHSTTPANTTQGGSLPMTVISLLWPPLSVIISLVLLRYWVNAKLKPSTSFLPTFSSNSETTDAGNLLENKMVLLAFLHMLLMLSRLLACAFHLHGIMPWHLPTFVS